jgi:hypothetical protein
VCVCEREREIQRLPQKCNKCNKKELQILTK